MIYLLLLLTFWDVIGSQNSNYWFFEAQKLLRQSLANNMTNLLDQYGFLKNSLLMSKMRAQNWILL
jgi:hypothetical protein